MNWKYKSIIVKIFSLLPYGDYFYLILQKLFGTLTPNPKFRYKHITKTLNILKINNIDLSNKTIFEVGTGHFPIIPIFFFLFGAKKIYTYDLNKRLQYKYLKKTIDYILNDIDLITDLYSSFVDKDIFIVRLNLLKNIRNKSNFLLSDINIIYTAPGDARFVDLPSNSIDIHYSCTVFEHIPFEILDGILYESKRLVKKNGVILHLIDPSDHFAHQDKNISKINFLKYSNQKWKFIADNKFAYCNRLRYSDFINLFNKNNYNIVYEEKVIDERSLNELKNGFKVNSVFENYSISELATTEYNIMAIN
jgi:hypothetical protein